MKPFDWGTNLVEKGNGGDRLITGGVPPEGEQKRESSEESPEEAVGAFGAFPEKCKEGKQEREPPDMDGVLAEDLCGGAHTAGVGGGIERIGGVTTTPGENPFGEIFRRERPVGDELPASLGGLFG